MSQNGTFTYVHGYLNITVSTCTYPWTFIYSSGYLYFYVHGYLYNIPENICIDIYQHVDICDYMDIYQVWVFVTMWMFIKVWVFVSMWILIKFYQGAQE